ncbi:MAG TPA: HEAT repeat domain-containing protein [Woeseiaceae bacterium]|nr:HEAT repeat domain-containing protein [Woeseiaceae bacterium]
MYAMQKLLTTLLCLSFAVSTFAQSGPDDNEELKSAALEALISAPPERALPLAIKVLKGNNSDELKAKALFILSQIDTPEAQELLVATAKQESGALQQEAIRMIGIGGDKSALAAISSLYSADNEDLRDAVLEAYLIAGDADAVYQLALNAKGEEEFGAAVDTLGAMGANEQLRQLRDRAGASESWIEAIAVSGDADTLRDLATDKSNPERQLQAIEALGIVGGDSVNKTLLDVYKAATRDDVREAALDGMLIAGYDQGVLELYRASNDAAEKKHLLEYLVMMDSDEVWTVIDSALDGAD